MKLVSLTIKLTVALASCALSLMAQTVQEKCEMARSKPEQAPVIISLEQVEVKESPSGKPLHLVQFRLTNNTACKVTLATPNQRVRFARIVKDESGQPRKNPHGGLSFDHSNDVLNNSLTNLDVYVYSTNPAKGYWVSSDNAGDVRYIQSLRSNESLLFQIDEISLKKGRILSVDYGYEGEKQADTHKATLAFSQLLKQAINQSKKAKTQNASN